MSLKIYLAPSDMLLFYSANLKRLEKETVLMAENTSTNHSIYLTDGSHGPVFEVYREDIKLWEEESDAPYVTCEDAFKIVLDKYLVSVDEVIDTDDDDCELLDESAEDDIKECNEEISSREEEILYALDDFLAVLFDSPYEYNCLVDTDVAEMMDEICVAISKIVGIEIYRPKWVNDGEKEEYVEFPYSVF